MQNEVTLTKDCDLPRANLIKQIGVAEEKLRAKLPQSLKGDFSHLIYLYEIILDRHLPK